MKVKPLGAHLAHLTEQELIEGEYTVVWLFEIGDRPCPVCGKDNCASHVAGSNNTTTSGRRKSPERL